MGRQAHLLRLALGRSADLPPDWEALSDQYERIDGDGVMPPHYRCIDPENRVSYGKTFDEKGRPLDMHVRELDAERCKAQNDVLALGVWQGGEDEAQVEPAGLQLSPDSEILSKPPIFEWVLVDFIRYTALYPIVGLRRRVLVFNISESVNVLRLVRSEVRAHGLVAFMFAGYPSSFIESQASRLLQLMSRRFESTPYMIPQLAELCAEIMVLIPLSLFSKLQQLHLISNSLYLPPLSSLAPWSRSSPLVTRTDTLWATPSAATSLFLSNTAARTVIIFIREAFEGYALNSLQLFQSQLQAREEPSASLSIRGRLARIGFATSRTLGWPIGHQLIPPDAVAVQTVSGVAALQSHILGDLIILPLQAILLRVIAHRFLDHASTPAQVANAAWFRPRLFPILGPSLKQLGTLDGAKSVGRYVTNVAFCTGMYIAVELLQQALQNAVSIWLVKRRRSKDGQLRGS